MAPHVRGRRISLARNQREDRWETELRPWRWRRHIAPKSRLTFKSLPDVMSQKPEFFITTGVRTSNPTYRYFCCFNFVSNCLICVQWSIICGVELASHPAGINSPHGEMSPVCFRTVLWALVLRPSESVHFNISLIPSHTVQEPTCQGRVQMDEAVSDTT
jgi:hypothetical protein